MKLNICRHILQKGTRSPLFWKREGSYTSFLFRLHRVYYTIYNNNNNNKYLPVFRKLEVSFKYISITSYKRHINIKTVIFQIKAFHLHLVWIWANDMVSVISLIYLYLINRTLTGFILSYRYRFQFAICVKLLLVVGW